MGHGEPGTLGRPPGQHRHAARRPSAMRRSGTAHRSDARRDRAASTARCAARLTRGLCSTAAYDRAGHTYGKAFRDVVRALRRDFRRRPTSSRFRGPSTRWFGCSTGASTTRIAAHSVRRRLERGRRRRSARADEYRGAVSIDLGELDRVLEIDRASRAARIQAGVYGPALEDQLRPHGLTLRHFPQSFEFSTLGGWIATRSGGHYATLYTHIDDFVESLRVGDAGRRDRDAPSARLRRGPEPGPPRSSAPRASLGIITEAWMRLQDRPTFRASASVTFADFRTRPPKRCARSRSRASIPRTAPARRATKR